MDPLAVLFLLCLGFVFIKIAWPTIKGLCLSLIELLKFVLIAGLAVGVVMVLGQILQ